MKLTLNTISLILILAISLTAIVEVNGQKGRSFVNANRSPARKVQGIKSPQRLSQSKLPLDFNAQLGPSNRRRPPQAAAASPVRPAQAGPALAGPARTAAAPSSLGAAAAPFRTPVSAAIAPLPSRPAPAPAAPIRGPSAALAAPIRTIDSDDGGPHPAPEPYSFSFAVNDEESGSQLTREESQDINGNVVGFYYILDAEGRRRRVDYTAGPEGFKATISSNEEGLMNRNAADADFNVEVAPIERQNAAAAAAQAAARSRARARAA